MMTISFKKKIIGTNVLWSLLIQSWGIFEFIFVVLAPECVHLGMSQIGK
jgi:hypothetical protein